MQHDLFCEIKVFINNIVLHFFVRILISTFKYQTLDCNLVRILRSYYPVL